MKIHEDSQPDCGFGICQMAPLSCSVVLSHIRHAASKDVLLMVVWSMAGTVESKQVAVCREESIQIYSTFLKAEK